MSHYQAIEEVGHHEIKKQYSIAIALANSCSSIIPRKFRKTDKCITSKAALLVLLWTFLVSLIYGISHWVVPIAIYFSKSNIKALLEANSTQYISKTYHAGPRIVGNVAVGVIFCLYPLAGFWADNKIGRYNTIMRSLNTLVMVIIASLIIMIILLPIYFIQHEGTTQTVVKYIGVVLVCLFGFVSLMSIVGFVANVIQFGVDQLYDSPGNHQSLFIYWYMWTWYLGFFISELSWNILLIKNKYNFIPLALIPVLTLITLILSLYIAYQRKSEFLIDSARHNPYKLVFKVTKFAHEHKVPVQRSAFTYCEDEVPSGLDLGKAKYGGPFTTEQVEDVKALYGILKILFSLGPIFFLETSSYDVVFNYYVHLHEESHVAVFITILLEYGLLSPLLIVTVIPTYICLVRPLTSYWFPKTLQRIGLGLLLMIASILYSFILDTVVHLDHEYNIECMFLNKFSSAFNVSERAYQSPYYLIFPISLHSLSTILIYVSLFEFISSQSPHSMKGMLIGLGFAFRGIFRIVAALLIIPPLYSYVTSLFPSCGMYYYLANIFVGVFGFLLFVFAAKRYKFRKRDEVCNIYRFAEEYYSKIQQSRKE